MQPFFGKKKICKYEKNYPVDSIILSVLLVDLDMHLMLMLWTRSQNNWLLGNLIRIAHTGLRINNRMLKWGIFRLCRCFFTFRVSVVKIIAHVLWKKWYLHKEKKNFERRRISSKKFLRLVFGFLCIILLDMEYSICSHEGNRVGELRFAVVQSKRSFIKIFTKCF